MAMEKKVNGSRNTAFIFPAAIAIVLLGSIYAGKWIDQRATGTSQVTGQETTRDPADHHLGNPSHPARLDTTAADAAIKNRPSAPAHKTVQPQRHDEHPQQTDFETALDYHQARRQASRAWRELRGYHLAEDFADYDGPENYIGPHSYGYLSESDLKSLAESGDVDAQVLYASFYLQDNPEAAREMLEDVVVKTEQTAPLMILAGLLLKQQDPGNGGAPDTENNPLDLERYNDAMAYFVYMKDRNDSIAGDYLQISGFNSFPETQQQDIARKATGLKNRFDALRSSYGFNPYVDTPLNLSDAMGLSPDRFAILEKTFDYTNLDPETLDALRISTSYKEKYSVE